MVNSELMLFPSVIPIFVSFGNLFRYFESDLSEI